MSAVLTFEAPRLIGSFESDDPPLQPKEVRLQTLYSGISAGTELTAYRGSNPYLHRRWDGDRRLFVSDDQASLRFPVVGWGYEECGRIVEVGSQVERVHAGQVVYGTWGHRTCAVVDEAYAAQRILPNGIDPILGIFSQMAAISLNGVHDAAIRIGETVAVFGLGVPGQIIAQLARRSGARVIGVDLYPLRRRVACDLGAVDYAIDAAEGNVAEQIRAITDNLGADVCIEATGSYRALHEAIRSAAYSGKVVTLGFFQGQGQGLALGEEFHHNRINLVCSQIFGVNPELSYRWNQSRLVATAMRLQAEGVLNLNPLITQIYPFAAAAEAFRLCDEEPEKTIQVVLDFTQPI
jgi:2-desacetyl-2-hydroxyethyl bacteriochlorophyllide A dehydrogenase